LITWLKNLITEDKKPLYKRHKETPGIKTGKSAKANSRSWLTILEILFCIWWGVKRRNIFGATSGKNYTSYRAKIN